MFDQSLEKTIAAYLAAHHVVTLATVDTDGPWASAVFYVADELDLIFLSAAHTRHGKALTERVAGAIQDAPEDWRDIKGVQLEGTCVLLEGDARADAIALYQKRFPVTGPSAPKEIAAALDKVGFYRLTPERIFFIDNTQGLGHRDVLELGS